MNERIRELAGKALDQAVPYTWTSLMPHELDNFAEKFAELIVRECMEQIWYTREDGINGNVSLVIKDRIKQHFGVES
jgi:hypothetical protein